jgi:murein DD-endopeptidase MepM/ murein hydrolase activator NlpD
VAWTPSDVAQGTLFQLTVSPRTGAIRGVDATFANEPLHFFEGETGSFSALAAAPVDAGSNVDVELEITYASGATGTLSVGIPVRPGDYRMERLTVAPEFGAPPPPEIQARINDENARAMAVSRGSHGTARLWEMPFVPPRDSGITSGFGHGRMFNDQVQSRHTGTDFGGGVGAPVVAPARGRVALVDAFYLGGNVIYLDHGAGLVTAYLHLSEQNVQTGDIVEPGQVIGHVGATGRVTGPHLHWIVRYGIVSVDGLSLLALR